MKFIILALLILPCLTSFSQGWKFDNRISGVQDMMAMSATRIEAQKNIGKLTGTGVPFFFFKNSNPSRQVHTIITTRHLVNGARSVRISLPVPSNAKLAEKDRVALNYEGDNIRVMYHSDTNVDLCAIIISKEVEKLQSSWAKIGYAPLNVSILADESFYKTEKQLDPVVMIGYPDGIMDDVNSQPIFRRGVYATNPALDYKGRKEFLLDIPNHGGSRGSPVFHFDDRMYNNRASMCANITIGSRLVLVGISFDAMRAAEGDFPMLPVTGPSTSIAYIIKATRIKEISDAILKTF